MESQINHKELKAYCADVAVQLFCMVRHRGSMKEVERLKTQNKTCESDDEWQNVFWVKTSSGKWKKHWAWELAAALAEVKPITELILYRKIVLDTALTLIYSCDSAKNVDMLRVDPMARRAMRLRAAGRRALLEIMRVNIASWLLLQQNQNLSRAHANKKRTKELV